MDNGPGAMDSEGRPVSFNNGSGGSWTESGGESGPGIYPGEAIEGSPVLTVDRLPLSILFSPPALSWVLSIPSCDAGTIPLPPFS